MQYVNVICYEFQINFYVKLHSTLIVFNYQ